MSLCFSAPKINRRFPRHKRLNNFQNRRKYKTIKLLINCCFFTYRENPGWQLEPWCQIAVGETELCEQENREDNDVNIGHLDPQCSHSAVRPLKYAACGVWRNFLVWFGTEDPAVYRHANGITDYAFLGCV